ncbi:MAG TPA: hypothetical protein V6D11_21355 [Waterburya sp.]
MNSPNNSRTKRSTLTKAELETTVVQLRAALEKAENVAQNQEKSFADLKGAREESQKREKSLQAELETTVAQLRAALEKTENVAQDQEKSFADLKGDLEESKKREKSLQAELETTVAQLRAALEKTENVAQDKERTFADLKDALEKSHKKEKSLQKEISDLQAELDQQKKSIQNLQKELDKTAGLKAEIEKVKTSAIQLAQTNEKLIQEIDTLKKGNAEFKTQTHTNNSPSSPQKQGRPIQKESDKPADFATKSWLL